MMPFFLTGKWKSSVKIVSVFNRLEHFKLVNKWSWIINKNALKFIYFEFSIFSSCSVRRLNLEGFHLSLFILMSIFGYESSLERVSLVLLAFLNFQAILEVSFMWTIDLTGDFCISNFNLLSVIILEMVGLSDISPEARSRCRPFSWWIPRKITSHFVRMIISVNENHPKCLKFKKSNVKIRGKLICQIKPKTILHAHRWDFVSQRVIRSS